MLTRRRPRRRGRVTSIVLVGAVVLTTFAQMSAIPPEVPAAVSLTTGASGEPAADDSWMGPSPPAETLPALDVEALTAALDARRREVSDYGDVSISVVDVVRGERVSLDGGRPMVGASTTKLPVALALTREVSRGRRSLEEVVTTIPAVDEETGEVADRPYTLRDMARDALVHSDNDATVMLIEELGEATVRATMSRVAATPCRGSAERT